MHELIEDMYPASFLQSGMLIESMMDKKYATYHDVFCYRLQLPFHEIKFLSIWEALIAKHELLRAKFIPSVGYGYTIVIEKTLSCLRYARFSNENISMLLEQERQDEFDFSTAGLFRLLINTVDDAFDLIFSFHHCIADGWSVASLLNEFIQTYVKDQPIQLFNTPLHYAQFVRQELIAIDQQDLRMYWASYLEDLKRIEIKWNFSGVRSPIGIFHARQIVPLQETQRLFKLAKTCAVTVDSLFLYVYMRTLQLFLNHSDLTIGTVVHNRLEIEDGGKQFGLFLNTIPLRLNLESIQDHVTGIRAIFSEKIKLHSYQRLPYFHIKSLLKQDAFDFAFNFTHFHVLSDSIHFISEWRGFERTNIPFLLQVSQDAHTNFHIKITAHDHIIDKDYLNNFMAYFYRCLQNILSNGDLCLALTPQDRKKVLHWSQSSDGQAAGRSDLNGQQALIHELFEAQVLHFPEHVAVIDAYQKYSYQTINEHANRWAHYLRANYRIQGDDLIALCIHRSAPMIMAILAILKAGAGYIPIDPQDPDDRIFGLLQETKPSVLITDAASYERMAILCSSLCSIECFDDEKHQERVLLCSKKNPVVNNQSNHLAYVLYTSGTTGKPKGVMMEHQGTVIRIQTMISKSGLNAKTKYLFKTPYTFDVSFSDIFCVLCSGGQLVMTQYPFDIPEICHLIEGHEINVCHFVPSQLKAVEPAFTNKNLWLLLSTILVSGEGFDVLDTKYSHIRYVNYYGPTETGEVSYELHERGVINTKSLITIGYPFPESRFYVLGQQLEILPVGVVGELYISGISLARGYLSRTECSNERFITNPFQNEVDKLQHQFSRLYKTGDKVRYLPNGNIEYLGRDDRQLKRRGVRIDLNAIENTLAQVVGVKQACVLAKHRDEQIDVIGYYVFDPEYKITEQQIFVDLNRKLSTYMLPDFCVALPSFPLTAQGKINYQMLLKYQITDNYSAPENVIERQLCALFGEILHRSDPVGIHDDFFLFGGHSMTALQLVTRINAMFGTVLTISDVFLYRTSHVLSKHIFKKSDVMIYSMGIQQKTLPILHFIHTLISDAYIYHPLSEYLNNDYQCVGINHYHLHCSDDMASSSLLAQHYLDLMKQHDRFDATRVQLFGYSSGGKTALEIAHQLERCGHTNITVYLLDSGVFKSTQILNPLYNEHLVFKSQCEIILKNLFQNVDDDYLAHVLSALDKSLPLYLEPITFVLNFTQIILIKTEDYIPNVFQSIAKYPVQVFTLKGCDHLSILHESAAIAGIVKGMNQVKQSIMFDKYERMLVV